jgi:hypothetical protein
MIRNNKTSQLVFVFVIGLVSSLLACGGDDGPNQANRMTVSGLVQGIAGQAGASPIGSADIEVRIDRNGDGRIGQGERFQTTADSEGNYSVQVAGRSDRNLVVTFRSSGWSSQHHAVEIDEVADVSVNGTLRRSEILDCRGTRCSLDDGSLEVRGLPEGFSGNGRTFNPVTETDAFPGEFADDQDNLLVSGVFANIEMEDEQGNDVDQLDDPATLRMRFPRDTWSAIRDIQPGNDQIDVPLYYFDETDGEWKRDGQGVIVDQDDEVVAESELSDIQTEQFDGNLYARGDVEHFSYWNVDWPIETHGSISGTIVTAGGGPATGGTLNVTGTTYAGASSPQTLGGGGAFCVDVMRSETMGEDIDGDGDAGETHEVAMRVTYDGKIYNLGRVTMETSQSSCQTQNSQDLGTLELLPELELKPEMCSVTVETVDETGTPIEGVVVYAGDYALFGSYFEQCTEQYDFQQCYLQTGQTDALGQVELQMLVLNQISFGAYVEDVNPQAESSWRRAQRTNFGCPSETVRMRLDQGFDQFDLAIDVSGDSISWSPEAPATQVSITSEMGDLKWYIFSGENRIMSPVTYGQLPQGAFSYFPFDGSQPEALASGDKITVYANDASDTGIFEYYIGETVVP